VYEIVRQALLKIGLVNVPSKVMSYRTLFKAYMSHHLKSEGNTMTVTSPCYYGHLNLSRTKALSVICIFKEPLKCGQPVNMTRICGGQINTCSGSTVNFLMQSLFLLEGQETKGIVKHFHQHS